MHAALNSWIELDASAVAHNVQAFRKLIGPERLLATVVKANAYGHGLLEIAQASRDAGADWLSVHSLEEGLALRDAGHDCPVLVLGQVPLAAVEQLVEAELRPVVVNPESLRALSKAATRRETLVPVHLKLECGTHRQGVDAEHLKDMLLLLEELPGIFLEGVSTHYANIEDTTDQSYAREQFQTFQELCSQVESLAGHIPIRHTACTAAAIVMPDTQLDLIRLGIGLYGFWPSRETFVSASQGAAVAARDLELRRVLSWKCRLSQIKQVPAGSAIGYGCTYKTTRPTVVGILPVGYSDGLDRGLSNDAHVLVRGRRARILGRVCMNLTIIDLTDVGPVQLEDEVVLLGSQGNEEIQAEDWAALLGTIHYEVVARLSRAIPRFLVSGQ